MLQICFQQPINHNNHNAAPREKGKYDNYHAYLDKIQQDRAAARVPDIPPPVNKKPGDFTLTDAVNFLIAASH